MTRPERSEIKQNSGIDSAPWCVELKATDVLEVQGKEGQDLLQRISTNDLNDVAKGWVETVLTNEKGRMIDVLWVRSMTPDVLIVISRVHPIHRIKEWIERFVIREDIQLNIPGNRLHHFVVVGNERIEEEEAKYLIEEDWNGKRIAHALVEDAQVNRFRGILEEKGIEEHSAIDLEALRIAAKAPYGENEITGKSNPLEAGLESFVSWTKGCYVGQEVIARLDTYKKIQKRLVRLKVSEIPSVLPAPLFGQGGECGELTSVARDGSLIALGFVSTKQLDMGGEIFASSDQGKIQVVLQQ